jgi:hypothetical protein
MERATVEVMAKVAQKIAQAKKAVGDLLDKRMCDYETYAYIRDQLDDGQELMAVHCGCAPIRLITGQVDEIMSNHI